MCSFSFANGDQYVEEYLSAEYAELNGQRTEAIPIANDFSSKSRRLWLHEILVYEVLPDCALFL